MSQAGGPSEIGSVSIGVHADTSSLGPEFAAAKANAASAAAEMGAATEKVAPGADKAKKSIVDVGVESQKSFRGALGLITRTTAALGAMTGAAVGIVKVIERIFFGLDQGTLKAAQFQASLGAAVGENAHRALEGTADRIAKIDEELGSRASKSIAYRLLNSREALDEEKRLLIQSLPGINQAVQRQKQVAEAAGRANSKAEAEQFGRELADEQRTRDRELEEERQQRDNASHQQKLDRAKEIGDAARAETDPFGAHASDVNEQFRAIAAFRAVARGQFEKDLADAAESALVEASSRWVKKLTQQMRLAIEDAILSAAQQQSNAAGIQGMTGLLQDIKLVVQAIGPTIPRDYSGPLPGIPGGGI